MENSTMQPIVAVRQNSGLMNFIVGKLWLNDETGRLANLNINRDLPQDLVLKAGTSLLLTKQTKRPGKMDADYSVSILLPTEQAKQLIQATKDNTARRNAADQNDDVDTEIL